VIFPFPGVCPLISGANKTNKGWAITHLHLLFRKIKDLVLPWVFLKTIFPQLFWRLIFPQLYDDRFFHNFMATEFSTTLWRQIFLPVYDDRIFNNFMTTDFSSSL